MKLAIVTDSTSDFPAYLAEQFEIQIVSSILVLDGKEYADGIGISREDFYTRLPSLQTPPTTAAPSIGDFITPYQSLLDKGYDHILSIHTSGQLSAIINVARKAAEEFPNKVTCIDSGSLSMGLGFQVLAAAESLEFGLQAAIHAAESTRKRLKLFAALDTMEYLKRSGRIPGAVADIGGMLSIKPLVELIDGKVKPVAVSRTAKQNDERVLSLLLECGDLERLAILHTNAEPRAKDLLNKAMGKASKSIPRDISFVNVTAVIGTHLGPNAIGFAAISK